MYENDQDLLISGWAKPVYGGIVYCLEGDQQMMKIPWPFAPFCPQKNDVQQGTRVPHGYIHQLVVEPEALILRQSAWDAQRLVRHSLAHDGQGSILKRL